MLLNNHDNITKVYDYIIPEESKSCFNIHDDFSIDINSPKIVMEFHKNGDMFDYV